MTTALQSAIPAVPSAAEWDQLRNFAALLSRSSLIPQHYQGKPENIMWAAQMARAYDVPLAYYMESTYPLPGGKNGHYVNFKLGMARRACPDFDYQIIQNDDVACILEGWRASGNRIRTSFTMEQARKASLAGKDTYKNYGEDMLFKRAMSRLVDRVCPDAGLRMRAPEIVTGFEDEDRASGNTPQRSEAVVVEDGAGNAGAAPAALVPTSTEANGGGVVKPVPIDWRGRLLDAFAQHYGVKPPGESLKVRNTFVKANEEKLVFLANEFYKTRGEATVTKWMAVPPMDLEALAKWLEERNKKRAGEVVPTASAAGPKAGETQPANTFDDDPDADVAGDGRRETPADAGAPPPEDDETPPSPEPVTSGWEALVAKGHLNLTNLLMAMRHASKNERQYVQKSDKGRYALIDGDILKECGFVNKYGTVMGQFLDKLQDGVVWDGERWSAPNDVVWPLVCKAVYDAAQLAGVSTQ